MRKYEDKLKDPPLGKPFVECFDTKTLRPTQEWLDIYNLKKKELAEAGLEI